MGNRSAVVFMGNSIFGDDQIGLEVGRVIGGVLEKDGFDAYVLEGTGLAVLDCLEGHENAVIVDSYCDKGDPVGLVRDFSLEDFRLVKPAAPHFSGVPEAVQLMKDLGIEPPATTIIGINVRDPYTFADSLSEEIGEMASRISEEVYERISVHPGAKVAV